MQIFKKQAERFGTEIKTETINSIKKIDGGFSLESAKGSYEFKSVIISSGASAKWLDVKGEKELQGHGVSACATCDGFFFKDKKVLVVGGGDSAMEEATYLTKFASEVVLVHRREEFRASKIMVARALANPKITVAWNSTVYEILGSQEKGVHAVTLKDTQNGETREEACDGVFMAIGHKPNTDLFGDYLDSDHSGYLVTKNGSTATNIEGVFACGDVQDHVYRQAVTAAGSGCMSAIDAERFLEQNHSYR